MYGALDWSYKNESNLSQGAKAQPEVWSLERDDRHGHKQLQHNELMLSVTRCFFFKHSKYVSSNRSTKETKNITAPLRKLED